MYQAWRRCKPKGTSEETRPNPRSLRSPLIYRKDTFRSRNFFLKSGKAVVLGVSTRLMSLMEEIGCSTTKKRSVLEEFSRSMGQILDVLETLNGPSRFPRQQKQQQRRSEHRNAYVRQAPAHAASAVLDESDGIGSGETSQASHGVDQRDTGRGCVATEKFAGQRPERSEEAVNSHRDQRQRHHREQWRWGCAEHEPSNSCDGGRNSGMETTFGTPVG